MPNQRNGITKCSRVKKAPEESRRTITIPKGRRSSTPPCKKPAMWLRLARTGLSHGRPMT